MKARKIIRKTVNVITDILLIAALTVLVLSAYLAHQYKANPENAYLFGYKPILVLTGSMEPTMMTNSVCIAKKTTYDEVQVGDIMMYQIEDKLITHRIVSKTDEGITTKGDNNNSEDSYLLTKDHVRAKVVYVANWTASIVNDLQTTQGKIKWIVFPISVLVILGVLIHVIKKILREPEEPERNKDKNPEDEKIQEPEQTSREEKETVETPEPKVTDDLEKADQTEGEDNAG